MCVSLSLSLSLCASPVRPLSSEISPIKFDSNPAGWSAKQKLCPEGDEEDDEIFQVKLKVTNINDSIHK